MPLSKIMCALLVVAAAIPSAARTKTPPVLAACSAFAPDGTSGMATIVEDTLELSVVNLAGKTSKFAKPLKYRAQQSELDNPAYRWHTYDCSLFFNSTSSLVAVGVSTEIKPPQRLQIFIADVRAAKWLSDFGVEPGPEINSRLALVGFLKGTNTVVLARSWNAVNHGAVSILLFNSLGEQVSAEPPVRSFPPIVPPFYADARNNRLWVFHCTVISARASQQPFCPIDATTLAGGQESKATFDPSRSGLKRSEVWEMPRTFAAPEQNTVLIAESDTVWKVDVDTQRLTRFVLPQNHFLKWNFEHDGTISSDGAVFGFLMGQYRLAFPYIVDNYVSEGDDVVVLQVDPLRLLGVVRRDGVKYTRGLSIDHRNRNATVLVYRQDHWEAHEFPDVKP
jgi:hypothetical protein